MKIQVNKTVSEEVEITLPYFFKTSAHWGAILSEEEGIKITDCHGFEATKEKGNQLLSRFIDKQFCEEIEAQEFFAKYDEVNNIFKQTISTWKQKKS